MTMRMCGLSLLLSLIVAAAFGGVGANTGATAVNAAVTPTTTNNDDSCDIAILPAATLLLPYFEVDFVAPPATATTTLFSVTNVSNLPQIAHATIWTDWAYPVLDFNIFLTGYDVQTINLYDVIARGWIQPTTSNNPLGGPSPVGNRSVPNSANPNISLPGCNNLATEIGPGLTADIQSALTTGVYPTFCGSTRVGGTHAFAVGYLTIDVVAVCSFTLPTSAAYYSEILFDNVLTGDYQGVSRNPLGGSYATGGSLVHIRAVPEGGAAGKVVATQLPYTFYDRYTPAGSRTIDRRQPLPAAFAARYIQNNSLNGFATRFKIWREGVTPGPSFCGWALANAAIETADIIRFDEHENPTMRAATPCIIGGCQYLPTTFPATSASDSSSTARFPLISGAAGDVAGWIYLNLNNFGSVSYSAQRNMTGTPPNQVGNNDSRYRNAPTIVRPSQNWVTYSMYSEGRISADASGTALGNGCSLSPGVNALIGPNGGVISANNPSGNTTP
jgi:hypothetical protein